MKIIIKDARELHLACGLLLNGTHTIRVALANGATGAANIGFVFDDKARWNLLKNFELAERIVRSADKLKDAITQEIINRNGGKPVSEQGQPALFSEWKQRTDAVEDSKESAPFLRVKRSGLKEGIDNPVPVQAITTLKRIGPEKTPMLDDDTRAPDAADVVADEPEAATAST